MNFLSSPLSFNVFEVCFVYLDGCVARSEQMVESEQPGPEHHTGRKGKIGPYSSVY